MLEDLISVAIKPKKTILKIFPMKMLVHLAFPTVFTLAFYSYYETKLLLSWYSFVGVFNNMGNFILQIVYSVIIEIIVCCKTIWGLRIIYMTMVLNTIWILMNNIKKYSIFKDEYDEKDEIILRFMFIMRLVDELILDLFIIYIIYSFTFILNDK